LHIRDIYILNNILISFYSHFNVAIIKQAFKVFKIDHHVKDARVIIKYDDTDSPEPSPPEVSKINKPETSQNLKTQFESYGMSDENEDLVRRCPFCIMKFNHATYLLYHMMHIHKKKPSIFIDSLGSNKNPLNQNRLQQVQTCPRCMKKCSSPIGKISDR
jgi:hypothetical protein